MANRIPETIEELRSFCEAHRMPLEKMRFFIGEDYRGPRAFGIYRDENGLFVVYKNKQDGTRAVRYSGPDERRAVRELYEKLRSETDKRSANPGMSAYKTPNRSYSAPPKRNKRSGNRNALWIPLAVILAVAIITLWAWNQPDRGYYRYDDRSYYYDNLDWYLYNAALSSWEKADSVPDVLEKNYGDYYEGPEFSFDYGPEAFSRSEVYGSGYDYDDYDYDYSYDDDDDYGSYDYYDWDDSDYDSWDSDDTDWDSDW